MPMPQKSPCLTEADYLKAERAADFKSEFFDGEMFAMAGGSPAHSLIGANLAREFGARLRGTSCVTYNSDLRVKIEATGLWTYPDLSIICGPIRFADGTDDTVVNPSVIVEVLSDSTEAYDRGKKFEHYRHIATLREYLLVNQKEPRIEIFVRQVDGQKGRWLLGEASGLKSEIEVPSLGISLSLAEIFASVAFPEKPIRPSATPRAL